MVPFSLRLLHAHLPACTGSLPLALDRLCLLQGVCDEVLAALALSRLPGLSEPLSAHDTQSEGGEGGEGRGGRGGTITCYRRVYVCVLICCVLALQLPKLCGLSDCLKSSVSLATPLLHCRLVTWQSHGHHMTHSVAMQDYSMAVAVYEDILKQQPSLKVEILSGIGRLYLQVRVGRMVRV